MRRREYRVRLERFVTSFHIDRFVSSASFDKACRDLRIPYSLASNNSPGGALEAFADLPSTPLPRIPTAPFSILPFRNQLAFSYSGLRSALTRILAREGPVEEMAAERKRDLARAFVASAVEQVEEKVKLALRGWDTEGEGGPLQALVVSGGVASNQFLRMRSVCSTSRTRV